MDETGKRATAAADPGPRTVSFASGDLPPGVTAADLREMPCLFCGVHDERVRFVDEPFRVVECARCGHVYVNPRLPKAQLHEMYQDEYWNSTQARNFGYAEYLADAPNSMRTYRLRSKLIDAYKREPGRVLDVGCAAGFFLKVMARKGWSTTGIEIAQLMVDYGQQALDLPDMRRGDLTSVELEPGAYDVVTMWDVIEHLERPDEHLRLVHRALADDGILVLETQDVASRFARLLGRKWHHYKHQEHLYHFHAESLQRLLAGAGFRVLENTPRRGGKYVSMRFLVERVGRLHPVLSVLATPLRLLSNTSVYVNLRDEMVVVAVKA